MSASGLRDDLQQQLHSQGYAIVRGFFDADEMQQIGQETDRIYQEGLKHHTTYRHENLLLEVLDDPKAQRRVGVPASINPPVISAQQDCPEICSISL